MKTIVDALNRISQTMARADSGAYRADKEFKEEDHPRAEDGKFGSKSGAKSGSNRGPMSEAKTQEGGKRTQANGEPLPDYIERLKIPPAWTDVKFSADPNSDLLATGKDSKGRPQAIYSEAFTKTQAEAKFARIHELISKFEEIVAQNNDARKSKNARTRDSADCLDLIAKMGLRPGSDDDTGAKVKAYGATTLEGRHVVQTPDGVRLQFTGKKGVNLDLPVTDPALSKMLLDRAKSSGADGKLFPATSDKALLDHTHTMDGGGFKTKDFRTHVGTSTAADLVAKETPPKSEAEYKKKVMEIAKRVSDRLGNTPVIALQSYISPVVFAQWRASL
jgi:DNA topoisomerase-1